LEKLAHLPRRSSARGSPQRFSGGARRARGVFAQHPDRRADLPRCAVRSSRGSHRNPPTASTGAVSPSGALPLAAASSPGSTSLPVPI